ncbi:MAG TPA: GHMP kinase [Fibrobacteres bacterium]|nr:GHMP kinase [Fibrobacterota bacterium]
MNLFVPGRICLFGEHSDWAGGYRRINAGIEKGYALIVGTNQGMYAEVKPHPTKLVFRATLNDGTSMPAWEVPMERKALLEQIQQGGFFSYVAGVAYQLMVHYRVRGLEINNYRTDLPIKKGLSSSAAVCVLVARAFNRTYDLKMTIRGEMELAYSGEISTLSRCGRLDQGCAYGNRPIEMVFDGDNIDVHELSTPSELHYIIVDLMAGKDTREILSGLNRCYPFAQDCMQKDVQNYLGPVNGKIVAQAAEALKKGDAKRLGELMNEAQELFDKYLQPACPSQLTAPALHRLLSYAPLKQYLYGGKGVGSQGDGAAQLLAKDAESLKKAREIIERDLGMSCLELVLKPANRVRKAVIPAAGFGTRLFPATKAVKKELFPVIDSSGRANPAILAIVEEAVSAGIEEVCILVQSQDRELFEEIFCTPPKVENFNKLSKENRKYSEYLMDIGHRITFLSQDVQDGFGHAVYCAKEWVGDEPFLLMLGDHLYLSDTDIPCSRQLLDAYELAGRSIVGLKETPLNEVHHFGCATGSWMEGKKMLSVTEFSEKPDAEYAREHLHIEGMPDDAFLTVFGQYVLNSNIFSYLEENIKGNIRERGEFQLTSCLDRLRREEGINGYLVKGRRLDIGNPDAYLDSLVEFRKGALKP